MLFAGKYPDMGRGKMRNMSLFFTVCVLATMFQTTKGVTACVSDPVIAEAGEKYIFNSPGFFTGTHYADNLKCLDLIKAKKKGFGLKINVLHMYLSPRIGGVCKDSLVFYEGRLKTDTVLAELCGKETTFFTTKSQEVLVSFTTDHLRSYRLSGFSFEFEAWDTTIFEDTDTSDESDPDPGVETPIIFGSAFLLIIILLLVIFICWLSSRKRRQRNSRNATGGTGSQPPISLDNISSTNPTMTNGQSSHPAWQNVSHQGDHSYAPPDYQQSNRENENWHSASGYNNYRPNPGGQVFHISHPGSRENQHSLESARPSPSTRQDNFNLHAHPYGIQPVHQVVPTAPPLESSPFPIAFHPAVGGGGGAGSAGHSSSNSYLSQRFTSTE